MTARLLALAALALSASGCGGAPVAATDGGTGGSDAAIPGTDAASAIDAATTTDTGVASTDSGTMPEVCTGGLDEDGDTQIDCADSECWTTPDCRAADVTHMVPSLVLCGDPIALDATATAAACARIGMPAGSTYPTDCTSGTLEVTAYVYCDASGAPGALWIEERLSAPETQRMLSARRFEHTYYERASVIDWERQVSGISTREGGSGFPVHEGWDHSRADAAGFQVITVRPVMGGDVISRLLGMPHITSLIDLDMPMSMDSRTNVRLGGLEITVPRP